jgi:signal transduction histidine kinase/DNA-binding response OmpR family regulator
MIKNAIKRSISRKFMLAVLATTCAALLVSAVAMLAYDIQNYRTTWVNDLTTQADILAQASMPALEFNDPKVAQENLAQLKARPNIFASAIYASDGALFATYSSGKSTSSGFPRYPEPIGHSIENNRITLFKSISRNGETVGTVYLGAQYPLAERIQRYIAILCAVMIGGLGVAALVSLRLQAAVTRPILALTDAVHQVIRRRDFSLRVKKSTNDEVGVLVDAFNSMLTEVGERAQALESSNLALQHEMKERRGAEEALRQLNNTLEERIAARTAELARAHEQLRQSQKMEAIGQLTGGVAHDFNNVLQVIVGNLQLLQPSLAGNSTAQRRLETAAFAADRGAKLSSQLLAFARRQPLQPVPTNLGRILRGTDDLLRRALGESIQIETIVAGGLWNTMVDPNQLENVILNLAINARDAMKAGGKLTLELGNAMLDDHYVSSEQEVPAGQYVMLAISDTGTGMSPEVMERAFEPFFTTKREGEGTGLGLSMAYGFVKQSNGHIKIYSEVGSGTTIKIYLPRDHQAEVSLTDVRSGSLSGGTETILVVEDDAAVQATAVDMLTGLGYRVLKAQDGESALVILQSGIPINLLFTDVVMPGPVRSPALAKQAKQLFPNIEVLFTSGYTQNAIVHGGRLDPGVELISKPYRREDLARKIRQMFENRQLIANAGQSSSNDVAADVFPEPVTRLRILVVEDNEDAQKMVCELLMALGYRVQGVSDAEKALDALAENRFDVLFTDVSLPGMSGVDLARKAINEAPALKVIFSSGYGAVESGDLGFKSASLPKPYNLKRLQQVLTDIESGE